MYRIYFAIFSLFALIMSSCSQDEVLDVNVNDNEVQITAQIENENPKTRANIGINGKGTFEEGDVITLNYGYSNQKNLTLTNGKWNPSISWSEIGNQTSFSAFYPQLNSNYSVFTHEVKEDQSKGDDFEKSDLLHASMRDVKEGTPVNLNFKHLMSCVTVVLKSNIYSSEQLKNATIKIKAYNKIQVNSEGELGYLHDYDHKQNISNITFRHKEGSTFQAIICPQSYKDITFMGVDNWLTISIGGKTYTVQNPSNDYNVFKSGKNVTFTYSFNDTKPDPEVGGKTVWVHGLGDIPPVENSAWIPMIGTKLKQLVWKNGDKWYDCDKKDSSFPTYNDHRLCWAASASNMIHWWLDQNSDLIGKYSADNNIPRAYPDHLESEIFEIFKQSFTDEGSYIEEGLNWYFLKKYSIKNSDASSLTNQTTGGYFKEVFKNVSNMAEVRGIANLNDFSSILKDAFNSKKAIGFNIYMAGLNNGGRHAMTIWGAKFDGNGKVSELYYCDNNDGGDISEKPHLIAAKVKDENGVRLQGSNENGAFTIKIEGVVLLDLKRAELKKYFNK